MKYNAVIQSVSEKSIAQEIGLEQGDTLCAINDEPISDILVYRFLIAEQELSLEILKKNGEMDYVVVEKDAFEDLGITFQNPLIEKARSCSNQCIFCFIDQLPKGMRQTLYFKDDDSRLSFLQGNYVTLTNMSEDDINRLIRFRVSPINISIHTTDADLRIQMLGNKKAGNILATMQKLAAHRIQMNGQIVLCRDVNDGQHLHKTLDDLNKLYPYLNSISVVPIGLTKHRAHLKQMLPYDEASAREVVIQVEAWQQQFLTEHGTRFVYLADEFYLMAQMPLPPYEAYEDFPQIENGVGLIACMQQEFDDWLAPFTVTSITKREVTLATGVSAYPFMQGLVNRLQQIFIGLTVHVVPIQNDFFGHGVTVSGLVTGQDLISQLQDTIKGKILYIPSVMLRSDGDIFLDDVTLAQVEQALGVQVITISNDGAEFIEKIVAIT
ncbi:MAG: DUF512 domain-containing protein [Hyphomonadaceae bacterium]|nr:DUF512 domain-containing protein [Clostridia bacterium]